MRTIPRMGDESARQAPPDTENPAPTPRAPSPSPSRAAKANGGAYPESVQRLIDELARLPGVGRRSAERLAFHVLKAPASEAGALARAIQDVKQRVRHCPICYNLMDLPAAGARGAAGGAALEPCHICRNEARDRALVMVVEQPKDLIALEQTGMYRGVYHVLMGRISPMEGVGPGDLTIADLLDRIDHPERNSGGQAVREVILGLNPTLEADGTALYLAQEIHARGVPVTRLARGLPTGSQLEFANKAVLADAIEGRRPM